MESWPHNIWFRRLLPFVLIVVVWFGYRYIDSRLDRSAERTETINARLTAQLWVAATRYRNEPKEYERFRDSLLAEYNRTLHEVEQYLKRYETSGDNPVAFTEKVNRLVDSIIRAEGYLGQTEQRPDPSAYDQDAGGQ